MRVTSAVLGLLAVAAVAAALPRPAVGAAIPGSAGVDTSLPATESQVTVKGRGAFADLAITVNQTQHLVNQAISVTWTGGKPTRTSGGKPFGDNYLQIMQCWGDDDGTVPTNPGPPPEQCVFGATAATKGGVRELPFPSGSFALQRIMSRRTWPNVFRPEDGVLDDRTGFVWRPFRAVDGTVVDVHMDPTCHPDSVGCNFWLNPDFNIVTTNEIAGARTLPNGTGAELFEVTTGVESSGLGCGQLLSAPDGGAPRIPKCWLVVVPRGDLADENAGLPDGVAKDGIATSPLTPKAWSHRIAIPLEFNPVDSPCTLADDERRLVGSELAIAAVASWQPALCSAPGAPPYSYATVADSSARQQLLGAVSGGAGMAVVSRPIDQTMLDPTNPVVYAPLTVSAAVLGFNIERRPSGDAPDEEKLLRGVRVAELNLTPRLVAKLLTQSYTGQVTILGEAPDYAWMKDNPAHLGVDPDFLQFNPEFSLLLSAQQKNFGGLVMPAGSSDAAQQLWAYVLADPEAKAWLDGQPDPWGMRVNPVYATTSEANTNGAAFGDPVPDSFPKSDPYCYQGAARPAGGQAGGTVLVPPPLCSTDWLPFSESFRDAARRTRIADDRAKVAEDPFAVSADQIYTRDIPQPLGSRTILSLTDSASAYQYGIQTARLSRAGDDGGDRRFIAPDVDAMTASVDAMKPGDEPAVLEPDPTAAAPSAYPLTMLTYAAVTPLALDDQARKEYAAFVDYAGGAGQTPGLLLGQLPRGYAPLPAALRTQAQNAADKIRTLQAAPVDEEVVEPEGAAPSAPLAEPTPAPAVASATSSPRVPSTSTRAPEADRVSASPAASVSSAPPVAELPPQRTKTIATPFVALAKSRFALPALGALALLSALGVLEITKRPRHESEGT